MKEQSMEQQRRCRHHPWRGEEERGQHHGGDGGGNDDGDGDGDGDAGSAAAA